MRKTIITLFVFALTLGCSKSLPLNEDVPPLAAGKTTAADIVTFHTHASLRRSRPAIQVPTLDPSSLQQKDEDTRP